MRRPTFIYGRLYLPVERHTASVEVLTPRTCAASLSSICSGGFFGLKPSASAISSLMDAAIWVLIILFLSRCNSMRWSFAWEGWTMGWMKILKFGHGSSTQRAAPLSRRAGGGFLLSGHSEIGLPQYLHCFLDGCSGRGQVRENQHQNLDKMASRCV